MSWFGNKRIYLDYASATPVLPEVKQVMESYWQEHFHNPSAIYDEGVKVRAALAKNRARIGRSLSVQDDGIIFTSSGTESDNLAILGAFEEFKRTHEKKFSDKPHLMITAIEHPAVTEAAAEVVRRGGELTVLEVNEEGLIAPEEVSKHLKRSTFLVSIGLANSEIGTIEPVAKVGRIIRKYRKEHGSTFPYLHTDASQAANFMDISPEHLQADMVTLDGSKVYGPKGIGVLALRAGVKIHPIIFGGVQEGGRRAGTPNPALISGMATALELALAKRNQESDRIENLRKNFIDYISKKLKEAQINGSRESHLPNIVSVSVPKILSEFVVLKLDKEGVMASVGTACSNDERMNGSPIIRAIGKPEFAESTIRFSFGRYTTAQEINNAAEIFCRVCRNMIK